MEQEGLHQEDHGDPLVIVDALNRLTRLGDVHDFKRHVVRVGDPADLVCIVHIVACEVCRGPAVDRFADVLTEISHTITLEHNSKPVFVIDFHIRYGIVV